MTIKQHGGIFGRNPTFNEVEVESLSIAGDAVPDASTILVDGDIGTTVQGYDADTAKLDVAQTFTAAQTFNENIVVANGKGIDFSATAGTGTSELFDDYEEGTFTPVVIGPTAGTATYSTQIGQYTKIGNVVNILIDLTWTGGTGSGGFLAVTGLPFTVVQSNTCLSGRVSDVALSASNYPFFLANVASTTIYIQQAPVGGGATTNINYDSAGAVIISGTYFV